MSLISPEMLLARLGDPDLRLADVRWYLGQPGRGREAWAAGHIPGAVFLDLDDDLSAPSGPGRHPLPEPATLARRLGSLGFGDRHSIVAYDDISGMAAARLWWMLDALGHPHVAVLDGGLGAWVAAGGPMTSEATTHPATTLTLGASWPSVIDRAALVPRLGRVDLVDLRAGERYRGEVEPVDPAAGHIPTARNLPATELLGPDGRLRPPGELALRLEPPAAGLDAPGTHTERVLSCGSGVTACFGILAHRVAGIPDPVLYPGSFSDWARSGLPVATGPEPGEPSG